VTLCPQAWLPEGSEEQLRCADHPSVWGSQCRRPRGGGQASHVQRSPMGCTLPSIPIGPVPWSVSEPRGECSPPGAPGPPARHMAWPSLSPYPCPAPKGRKLQGPLPPTAQPLQAPWQPPLLEQKVPLSQPSADCSGGVFISLPSPSHATPAPTGLQVLLMRWDLIEDKKEGEMTPTPSSPSFEKVQASESGGGAEGGSHGRCQKEGWRGHMWAVAWAGQSGVSCPAPALPK
uniref:Uncharacterized protein n=1 Tax=Pan troglodytes TaxID=9598 RepID=A0A2I3SQJ4_PANTR